MNQELQIIDLRMQTLSQMSNDDLNAFIDTMMLERMFHIPVSLRNALLILSDFELKRKILVGALVYRYVNVNCFSNLI